MFMDVELHTVVNTKIAQLVKHFKDEYESNVDLIVTQSDKYENTQYETQIIGLVETRGIKKEDYLFNALNSDKDVEIIEPVYYYEQLERVLCEIHVNPIARVIQVYEVGYTGVNDVVRTKLETIELNTPNKLKAKVV